MAASSAAFSIAVPAWGHIADVILGRRRALAVSALGAAVFVLLAGAPVPLVVVALALVGFSLFESAWGPLGDALAVNAIKDHGREYARIRLLSSVGFGVVSALAGILYNTTGYGPSFVLCALLAVLLALAAIRAPDLARADLAAVAQRPHPRRLLRGRPADPAPPPPGAPGHPPGPRRDHRRVHLPAPAADRARRRTLGRGPQRGRLRVRRDPGHAPHRRGRRPDRDSRPGRRQRLPLRRVLPVVDRARQSPCSSSPRGWSPGSPSRGSGWGASSRWPSSFHRASRRPARGSTRSPGSASRPCWPTSAAASSTARSGRRSSSASRPSSPSRRGCWPSSSSRGAASASPAKRTASRAATIPRDAGVGRAPRERPAAPDGGTDAALGRTVRGIHGRADGRLHALARGRPGPRPRRPRRLGRPRPRPRAGPGCSTPTRSTRSSRASTASGAEVEAGTLAWNPALEDVHMNLEEALALRIGALAGKLHTGRSRNDQVATDLRLWTRRTTDALDAALVAHGAGARRAGRPRGRRRPARHDPHPAGPAGPPGPPPPRLRGDARARPGPPRRLAAGERT